MQEPVGTRRFDVVLLTGRRIALTRAEASRIFLHPWLMTVYSLLSFLTVVMDQQPWTQGYPGWTRTAIYFVSSVIGLLAAWAMIMVLSWAALKGLIQKVNSIIFDLFGSFMSLTTTYFFVVAIGGKPSLEWPILATLFVYYVVIIVHVSIVLWSYLIPAMLKQIRASQRVADPQAQSGIALAPRARQAADAGTVDLQPADPLVREQRAVVVVNGQSILADTIAHVWAQGNYVNIHTESTKYFEAGTLQEIVSQLAPGLGMRVHRSHWIAFSAIKSIQSKGRDLSVTLKSGIQVPVSRSNHQEVRARKLLST
jgi:DNA-binding LytR/AlgR family response regulator